MFRQGGSSQFRQVTGISPLAEGDDLDPGAPGIPDGMVLEGADQFAHPATAANALGVLPVFKVANPLSTHLILRT